MQFARCLVNARTVMMADPARCAETRPGSEDGGMLLSSMVGWVGKSQCQPTAGATPQFVAGLLVFLNQ
jgi:hypothetical protein